MKPVDILIPNWHCLEAIELAVESIRKFTPPGDYRLIVHDDALSERLEKLDGFTYRNRYYLRECQAKGWLELIEAEKNIGHGASIDVLLKRSTADIAVILDCDTQILKLGWLEKLTSLFVDERDLVFCNTEEVHTKNPSLTTWFNPWFMALNMEAYRKDMEVDWSTEIIDGVWWNVGARLLIKVRDDNPLGYRIRPIPHELEAYYYHHIHVSCMSVVGPHDTASYAKAHTARFVKIRAELARLRGGDS